MIVSQMPDGMFVAELGWNACVADTFAEAVQGCYWMAVARCLLHCAGGE